MGCEITRKVDKPYVKNSEAREYLMLFYADVLNKSGGLESCKELTIGGDVEMFLSKGYKKVPFEDAGTLRKKSEYFYERYFVYTENMGTTKGKV